MSERGFLRALSSFAAVTATVLLMSCGGDDSPKEDSPSPEIAADVVDPSIDAFLEKTVPAGAPGSLVAARDGKMVHCAGLQRAGDDPKSSQGCDTAYDIMSMSKQFTAAAILKLEMMGKLRTSDRIGDHLPNVPADKRDITIHQLLTHTSGLPESLGGDYERLSRQAMIDRAFETKLASKPGARYRYSNAGYSLLGAIIEEASGTGYEEFLDDHLFGPAGMTATGYVLPDWAPGQVAVEYDAQGRPQGRPFEHPWADDGPYWNLRANGGLLSTPRDMFRWHLALEGDEVLDSRARRKLFAPHVPEVPGEKTFSGYGWAVQQTGFGKAAGHDGGNHWSYGEILRLLDQDTMVFWVTNRSRNDAGGWNMEKLAPALTGGVTERLLKR